MRDCTSLYVFHFPLSDLACRRMIFCSAVPLPLFDAKSCVIHVSRFLIFPIVLDFPLPDFSIEIYRSMEQYNT